MRSSRIRKIDVLVLILSFVGLSDIARATGPGTVQNLAMAGQGGRAQSWEPGVRVVPGHEPARAIDGSLHTYWSVSASDLPADLGVEWPDARKVSSLVVRYFDGKMVRGPAVARTQQWAQLQYWDQGQWKHIEATIFGQETSSVRYTFAPVTTTRIRVLFTEPPDPESRRFPDRLGIYVCELEAYSEAPFQTVAAGPNHVERMMEGQRIYLRNYNEPPQADADSDIPGPLVVEPKQTRVFTDTLRPNLVVEDSAWAKEPAKVETLHDRRLRIQNGFLSVDVSTAGELRETAFTNKVTGESETTPNSLAFSIKTSSGYVNSAGFKIESVNSAASTPEVASLNVDLTSEKLDLSVHYELRRIDHFLHKWITVKNKSKQELTVLDVTVLSLGMPRTLDLMAGVELTYPIFRMAKGGFFSNLETVYWDHVGDALTYYPGAIVPAGGSLVSEKGVIGVYRNRDEDVAGWDAGVREWVIEYHAQVSPLPKGWPDVYSEGWSGNFGIAEMIEHPERAEKRMAVAEKIGIKYMDTYEPTHAALGMNPEIVKRWVDMADRHHVATGFWADHGSAIDWGYGGALLPDPCKLSKAYDDYLEGIVRMVKNHHMGAMHWGDFLEVWPCATAGQGYLAGKYSIYPQGQRILRFAQELHEANPAMMLGADGGLTNPQYVRFTDSRSYGVIVGGDNPYGYDHYPAAEPDIHLDRLYSELNRNYFYDLHIDYLRPWYRLLNIVNHYSHEGTHAHDRAGFRFSLLSALGMAAQVTFDDIPPEMPESEIKFAHDWLLWAQKNHEYFTHGERLFDRTVSHATQWTNDPDALSGFSHIRKDRGIVALINPGAVSQIAALDLALEAQPSTQFRVSQIYPAPASGAADRYIKLGEQLRISVPGRQIIFLRVEPVTAVTHPTPPAAQAQEPASDPLYVGSWKLAHRTDTAATFETQFAFPAKEAESLRQSNSEALWSKDPWAFDQAYLVLLLKDETQEALVSDVPDDMVSGSKQPPIRISINGVEKTVRPFVTGRGVRPHRTRCYFVGLSGEVETGKENKVEITLPIRTGLVFAGAYVDTPDQMPFTLPEE